MTAGQGVVRQILYRLLAGGVPEFQVRITQAHTPVENRVADMRTFQYIVSI